MKVLCLDLSINQPGFAIGDTESKLILDYGYITNKPPATVYRRIERNLEFFKAIIHKEQIKAVWLELPAFSKRQKSHTMLVEQQGIFKYYCYKHNIPVSGIAISDIKKYITGKGNATKNEVVEGVKKHGFVIRKDDEADAIGVFLTGIDKPFLEQVN